MATNNQNIFVEWFLWHFFEMPKFLLSVWKNYIIFALNYFSLPILLKSFLAPWRNYRWAYPKGFDLGGFFSTLISNVFSRFLGAIMRIFLIIAGILFLIFVLAAGLVLFLLWVLTPFLIIVGILYEFLY